MNMHRIELLLKKSLYLNLSTVREDGTPWGSPLFFAYDFKEREFYWWSPLNSQHSKNLKFQPRCFITIFNSSDKEGEGFGLYFTAQALELSSTKEIEKGIGLYNQKAKTFKLSLAVCSGKAPTKMYRAKIIKAYINQDKYDENDNFYDGRATLRLS